MDSFKPYVFDLASAWNERDKTAAAVH
jgi:hypothetical protein